MGDLFTRLGCHGDHMSTTTDTRAESTLADATVAGSLYVLAGAVAFMGIVTAEVLYPDYSTRQAISDLGSSLPPDPVIHQPSATIFNATMLASGLLVLGGTYVLYRALGRRDLSIALAVFGVGVFGVGLFPGNLMPWHGLFSMLTFISGGVTALVSARVVRAPFRYLCALLGVVSLASLAVALFLGDSAIVTTLGLGGIERWVAYPLLLWLVGLGGYFTGAGESGA